MTKRWKYDDPNPANLPELGLSLEPGQEFDAPDEWLPEPNPHPVFKPADKAPKAPKE
jgi:hypothetical protein